MANTSVSDETKGEDEVQLTFTGIPRAKFVEDVDAHMALPGHETVEKSIRILDEQYSKYRYMEQSLTARKKRLLSKIPELKKTNEMVAQLTAQVKKNEELQTNFLLSDGVYLKAVIPPTKKVYLWLGANVMLEYSLEEASEVLTNNKNEAETALGRIEHDLDFLRDQLTTTEVNMARVYNWDVKRRQSAGTSTSTSTSAT